MIRVEMLAAGRGDAILLEYGPDQAATNRILIDGGPVNSGIYDGIRDRLTKVPVVDGRRVFDLLIVTHVDTDHIEGVIRLLQDEDLACDFKDIWFNGYTHLQAVSQLGGLQGEFLGALLEDQGRAWNKCFSAAPVVLSLDEPLPHRTLSDGMKLTLLSPDAQKLRALAKDWENAVQDAGFTPGDSEAIRSALESRWWAKPQRLGDDTKMRRSRDNSHANGSTIAVLAEYEQRRVLLAGDAHDDLLTKTLRKLRAERGHTEPLPIDVFKVPHHGSAKNLTELLLREIAVDHYLISTNGKRFKHPNRTAIRMLINRHQGSTVPKIHFNYRQSYTKKWESKTELEAFYEEGSVVELSTPGRFLG